ncbi:MAG: glycosyltransferase family 4 protein [Candidatus Micrarchaeaceae archaeon]
MVQEKLGKRRRRVAFQVIGGRAGTGGFNYLQNLLRTVDSYAAEEIAPVLIVDDEVDENDLQSLTADLKSAEIIRIPRRPKASRCAGLIEATLFGLDAAASRVFRANEIDVVFETAAYYGWRLPLPAIAWLTDFQHRHLPKFFGARGFLKREFGFRAQTWTNRVVMLSSEDARRDCERFYPASIGHTTVVRFATLIDKSMMEPDPRGIAETYNLQDGFFYLPNQFWVHKNHRIVVDALQLLKGKGVNVVVASSGVTTDSRSSGHYGRLREMVQKADLERNFLFLGLIPRSHVIGLMRACRALVNPSLFEGWSSTVEEAKSLGVPTILSDLRVHREQMGDHSRYFEPNSAQQLATLLATQPSSSATERSEVEGSAVIASQDRVRRFCDEFIIAVNRAIAEFWSVRH